MMDWVPIHIALPVDNRDIWIHRITKRKASTEVVTGFFSHGIGFYANRSEIYKPGYRARRRTFDTATVTHWAYKESFGKGISTLPPPDDYDYVVGGIFGVVGGDR